MLPVGPEGGRNALQRPDGCIGIAAFQARYGGLARSDLASQLSLREAESPEPWATSTTGADVKVALRLII